MQDARRALAMARKMDGATLCAGHSTFDCRPPSCWDRDHTRRPASRQPRRLSITSHRASFQYLFLLRRRRVGRRCGGLSTYSSTIQNCVDLPWQLRAPATLEVRQRRSDHRSRLNSLLSHSPLVSALISRTVESIRPIGCYSRASLLIGSSFNVYFTQYLYYIRVVTGFGWVSERTLNIVHHSRTLSNNDIHTFWP